ncbi:MAG: xanthine dehydrogenase family protein subunit M, partial [Pseudomonadota bacterium]|nr:xanthine dehydrogenase family protein subunit M [Pseudomonadota bacterium]
MMNFAYHRPRTLAEASRLLLDHGEASLFAGGTDLFVELREGLRQCRHAIDLKAIAELDGLSFDEVRGLSIGALATARDIETSPIIAAHYPDLAAAARSLGSIQVRNRATLTGNICRASPSADLSAPLLANQAEVDIHGPAGQRLLPIEQFFLGPGRTALAAGEIVTAVSVPPPQPGSGRSYLKLGRRQAMELATVGVAAALRLEQDRCVEVRIALGAVAPTPIRARGAERALLGQPLSPAALAAAAAAAMAECAPIDNVRASAAYRRD